MKVFVAGATGALGKQLVPMLVANGHHVVGMTRTEAKRDQLRSLARSPVADAGCRRRGACRGRGRARRDRAPAHRHTALDQHATLRS